MAGTFTIQDPALEALFPKHGWAPNDQGVARLWIPIARLLRRADTIRTNSGAGPVPREDWFRVVAFEEQLKRLALALRELRACTAPPFSTAFDEGADPEFVDETHRRLQLAAPWLDLTVVYLRRIADVFATAAAIVLFAHYRSAPWKLADLRKQATSSGGLRHLRPLADPTKLEQALADHTSWLDVLRGKQSPKSTGEMGLCDLMEHHAARTQVDLYDIGKGWETDATLFTGFAKIGRVNLLSSLPALLEDFCALLSEVHESVDVAGAYEKWGIPYGDCLILPGGAEHFCYYWPPLSSDAT
jgi:hypothetical protein